MRRYNYFHSTWPQDLISSCMDTERIFSHLSPLCEINNLNSWKKYVKEHFYVKGFLLKYFRFEKVVGIFFLTSCQCLVNWFSTWPVILMPSVYPNKRMKCWLCLLVTGTSADDGDKNIETSHLYSYNPLSGKKLLGFGKTIMSLLPTHTFFRIKLRIFLKEMQCEGKWESGRICRSKLVSELNFF